MRPTIVEQDNIRITQDHPDNVVIEVNGYSITLTKENTELLQIMLYEAYRSKCWKSSRAEKSAKWKESEPVQRFIKSVCRILNIGISDIMRSK